MIDGMNGPSAATCLLCLTTMISACGGSGGSSGSNPGSNSGPDTDSDTEGLSSTNGPETDGDTVAGMPDLPENDDSCSVTAQNQWVYDSMLDYYLFYDQVPVVDPDSFEDPETLLDAVRFEERDPFSFLTSTSQDELEVEEGREFGLGYNWGEEDDDTARITRVVTDGPFGRAGVERGDIIESIDGRPALEALRDGDFYDNVIFGTPERPGDADWTFRDRDTDVQFTRRMVAIEYAIDTVRYTRSYTNASYDGVVGYLLFMRFLETSEQELYSAFVEFKERGITDLVLDLRYNRGGRISIARKLASLVVGEEQQGALLQEYRFNDKYAATENYELRVSDELAGLGLRSLVVLVSSQTASASELIINALRPLMNVSVVGSATTSGKPYIQRGRDRCDARLNAVEAEAFNSVGASVFGGIQPDCLARQDWRQSFGTNPVTDEIEDMLLAGLNRVVFGTCEPFDSVQAKRRGGAQLEATYGQGSSATGGALMD